MTERFIELVLEESRWLPAALVASMCVVAASVVRQRRQEVPPRLTALCALNLFYGCMLGIMAIGHLLAVTVKAAQGTLQGSPWLLYLLGLGLAIPAWWLVMSVRHLRRDKTSTSARVVALNIWLGVCLLAAGAHNAPLAAPGGLNIVYLLNTRAVTGRAIVGVTVVGYLALFIGSLVFLASGATFEQFQGIE